VPLSFAPIIVATQNLKSGDYVIMNATTLSAFHEVYQGDIAVGLVLGTKHHPLFRLKRQVLEQDATVRLGLDP
jgi:hypothetical protein